jgi:hypothetical protein
MFFLRQSELLRKNTANKNSFSSKISNFKRNCLQKHQEKLFKFIVVYEQN